MKEIVISAIAALVITTGIAVAESELGANQTIYAPQSPNAETTLEASSNFDGFSDFEQSTLPSVNDERDAQTLGVR